MGKDAKYLEQRLGEPKNGLRVNSDEQSGGKSKRRGFFNAVANRLAAARLGDLLVESGLISKNDLTNALDLQRGSKRQLGEVLIELGAISPVQLYRKLAEQWVIKASAAGFTFFLSTGSLTPRAGMADTGVSLNQGAITLASAAALPHYKQNEVVKRALSSQNRAPKANAKRSIDTSGIILASAVSKAAPVTSKASYPAMFGYSETRSSDISGFTNWTDMMGKFERDLRNAAADNRHMIKWREGLAELKGKSFKDKVIGVNKMMNAKRYITDKANWNTSDYWATPVEFVKRGGDCEDFAIAKYASLRVLGVPADQMRLAVVMDNQLGIHHAILIVYDGNTAYVLDNQDKKVKELDKVTRYSPIYSINQQNWWLHKRA